MESNGRPMTIAAALARVASRRAAKVAYAGGGGLAGSITWGELHERAADFAAGLVALGLQHGDRVAICAENSIEWLVACHGTSLAGGVIVPIYYDLKTAEIAEQVRRPQCRFLVSSQGGLPKMPERSTGLERIIVIGDATRDHKAGIFHRHTVDTMTFEAVLEGATSESRQQLAGMAPAPEDLAVIIFTSGTTGGPKGVKLSHRNLLANAYSVLGALDLSASDAVLLVLPLHHAMPFMAGIILPAMDGATVIIENDVRRVRDRLAEERPTLFFGVPALYDIMYRNVMARAESEGRLETLRAWQDRVVAVKNRTGVNIGPILFRQVHNALGGRLRFLFSGGAALNPTTARNFFSLGLPLLQGWGMSEASPVISIQRWSPRKFRLTRYYEDHVGSVGPPLPGVEVRLIDVPEKDIHVSLAGEGEIIVRGDNVFEGYWQADEITRAVKIDDWLRTGDLGRFDKEGNIYLTGRSKYIIVLESGEKVHPDELEEKLGSSELIQEICVVGKQQRDKTQVAAIVYPDLTSTRSELLNRGESLTEEAVRNALSAEVERLGRELAPYKRIQQLMVSDMPLPKTPLQKVAREQLPDEFHFSVKRWQEAAVDGVP